jgi:hypothetical protein
MRWVFETIFNNTSDLHPFLQMNVGGSRGRDRNQYITTEVVSSNTAQARCTQYNIMWYSASDLRQVGGFFPISSTKNSDRNDIAEILLKVGVNTTTLTSNPYKWTFKQRFQLF